MMYLDIEQVIGLHTTLAKETGGSDGLRDVGLLESAISAPLQGFGGIDVYPSIQEKAARLGYGLIRNHAFIDGNKRIGTHTMLVFLALNGIELEYTQKELSDIILQIASGVCDYETLLQWIYAHQI